MSITIDPIACPAGGTSESVTGGVSDVLHDVTELAELQVKLLAADSKAAVRRVALPAALVALGCCLALGSVPVMLFALSSAIQQFTRLPESATLALAAGGGMLLAGTLGALGWARIASSVDEFDRSRAELSQNIAWVKRSFKRNGRDEWSAH
ncbi:MAG: phage holin family protein [Planctomycetales bacterium]|nr:phage holin family protein [Planctomycetales bacterium]